MSNHTAWSTLRDKPVEHAGGEAVVEATKREILAEITGHRLAEIRRSPGAMLTLTEGTLPRVLKKFRMMV